jgi:hypothetical protein
MKVCPTGEESGMLMSSVLKKHSVAGTSAVEMRAIRGRVVSKQLALNKEPARKEKKNIPSVQVKNKPRDGESKHAFILGSTVYIVRN